MDYWVKAITDKGLYMIRDDLTGLCKFANLDGERLSQAIREITGLAISEAELRQAVRQTFIRGLWLERRQGFDDSDYVLPEDIFNNPNPHPRTPSFLTPGYVRELKRRVFARFDPEMDQLCA